MPPDQNLSLFLIMKLKSYNEKCSKRGICQESVPEF